MVDNTNGSNGIRDYLHAPFSRMKDAAANSLRRLQQPAPSFPHKPFSLAIALILGFLQLTAQGEPIFDSNRTLYYTAVTAFLVYCLAGGFAIVSSTHPVRPMPIAAGHVLHRFMFLVGSLSFAATASFLFPGAVRPVMSAFIFTLISTIYLLYCVYPFQVITVHGDAVV